VGYPDDGVEGEVVEDGDYIGGHGGADVLVHVYGF
jgi:hypothetical protein